jgi:hypothetical protein
MNYVARMGKQNWCRVGEENIFTMPGFKMANELGMGFDSASCGYQKLKVSVGQ